MKVGRTRPQHWGGSSFRGSRRKHVDDITSIGAGFRGPTAAAAVNRRFVVMGTSRR